MFICFTALPNNVAELTDKFILNKVEEALEERFSQQFSLKDLVGKTIESHRKIKNPRKYNPEVESPNPEYFNALIFSDGTFLVTERWGDGESGHLNCYYYDGRKTIYSHQLFGIL